MNKDFDELGVSSKYRTKVRNYKQVISSYQCSVIDIPEARIDTATEIFTRINVTGKPLSVFEIMVAKTFDYDQSFDLSEKARNLTEELADHDYGTIPDIIFLQVSSAIIAKECAKKDILRLNKQEFIDTWDKTEDAIGFAVDYLRTSLHVPVSQLLPYKALLVQLRTSSQTILLSRLARFTSGFATSFGVSRCQDGTPIHWKRGSRKTSG